MDAEQFLRPSYSRTLVLALWRHARDFPMTSPLSRLPPAPHPSPVSIPRKSAPSKSGSGRTVGWWVWVLVTCLLVSISGVDACGPGRGAGRRRAPRKLTPLVYQQHVPNVPENALSASGLTEGKISRGESQRFKALEPNYNQDILFRDDEGTGADRLMTQKLREKLNTLAISVMNQWPGVKLRVIEGWDEDLHSEKSLHYEGRAVDIQTSDKDTSKYGMLARLAVEAGFDWVYYESRSHIHCSVKSDSFQGGRAGGCFSSNSTVETPSGKIRISELNVGDQVLTIDGNGNAIYSPILLFLDRNQSEVREFYDIWTSRSTSLRLTPSHLLYIIPSATTFPNEELPEASYFTNFIQFEEVEVEYQNEELIALAQITFARNIAIGDWILTLDPKNKTILTRERVLDVRSVLAQGVYAPLTMTGTILVDGVLSSCYAIIESQSLAHWSFLPIRLLHNLVQGLGYIWRNVNLLVTLGMQRSPVDQTIVKILSQAHGQHHQPPKPETRRSIAENEDGVYWYASFLYALSNRILPSSFLYNS